MFDYFQEIYSILKEVEIEEEANINAAVDAFVEVIESKKSIFVFGASHAGILTQELYYRAGGLVLVNPIFAESLQLNVEPITHTSQMERLFEYGTTLANRTPFREGDVLLLHSVSGRNPVNIDLGLKAREKGVKIITITNLNHSKNVDSRHPLGKNLYEISDIVIDNHGHKGDGAIQLESMDQRVGPSSTVIGTTIVNTIVVETVRKLIDNGNKTPPIFYSANLDGGDELNKKIIKEYKDSIHYKF